MMAEPTKKVLLMGPVVPPITGQSISFTYVLKHIRSNQKVKLINISNKKTIIRGFFLCLKILIVVLCNRLNVIYITSSRTFAGSVRDVILLYCARLKKVKVINHLHGSDFKQFYDVLPHWYQKIVFKAYSYIDLSIVLVDGMEEQYDLFPDMRKVTIKNCYSNELDCLPIVKSNTDTQLNLVYLSNIMQGKGIFELLEACDELFSKYNNLYLKIAGSICDDGRASQKEIESKFQTLLKDIELKYPNRINYIGVCTGSEKLNLLWKSDVFILPTYYDTEAAPISILEAMRAGNYIITTNFRYIPKMISEKNGQLIEPKSKDAIVKAIEYVLRNPDELRVTQNYNIAFAISEYNETDFLASVSRIILNE